MKLTCSRKLRTIYQVTEDRLLVGSGPVLLHPKHKIKLCNSKNPENWRIGKVWHLECHCSFLTHFLAHSSTQVVQITFCLEQECLAPATTQFVLHYLGKFNFQCIKTRRNLGAEYFTVTSSSFTFIIKLKCWAGAFFKKVLHENLISEDVKITILFFLTTQKKIVFCKKESRKLIT